MCREAINPYPASLLLSEVSMGHWTRGKSGFHSFRCLSWTQRARCGQHLCGVKATQVMACLLHCGCPPRVVWKYKDE